MPVDPEHGYISTSNFASLVNSGALDFIDALEMAPEVLAELEEKEAAKLSRMEERRLEREAMRRHKERRRKKRYANN